MGGVVQREGVPVAVVPLDRRADHRVGIRLERGDRALGIRGLEPVVVSVPPEVRAAASGGTPRRSSRSGTGPARSVRGESARRRPRTHAQISDVPSVERLSEITSSQSWSVWACTDSIACRDGCARRSERGGRTRPEASRVEAELGSSPWSPRPRPREPPRPAGLLEPPPRSGRGRPCAEEVGELGDQPGSRAARRAGRRPPLRVASRATRIPALTDLGGSEEPGDDEHGGRHDAVAAAIRPSGRTTIDEPSVDRRAVDGHDTAWIVTVWTASAATVAVRPQVIRRSGSATVAEATAPTPDPHDRAVSTPRADRTLNVHPLQRDAPSPETARTRMTSSVPCHFVSEDDVRELGSEDGKTRQRGQRDRGESPD